MSGATHNFELSRRPDAKHPPKSCCCCYFVPQLLQINLQLSEESSDGNLLFPEFELVTESEDYSDSEDEDDEEEKKSEEERMKEFEKVKAATNGKTNYDEATLEKMAASQKTEDQQFNKFKKRIQIEPEQV